MAEELPGGCRGGDQPPGDDLGRRTAATGDSAPAGGRFHGGCAPHCRRRKVRSAPFPPAAKTAPAPLRLLSPPRGARRGPLSVLPQKRTRRARCKRKGAGRAPVQWPSARTGVGVPVPAPIWPCLRARYALLRFPRLPSRGGWCGSCRGARTHLTSFSFRAFRFATRCPGGCRGRCLHRPAAEAFINHRPAAAKREAGCIPDIPGLKGSPRAGRFRL